MSIAQIAQGMSCSATLQRCRPPEVQAREDYFFNRRGLQFGLPKGAYPAAIAHAQHMKLAPSAAAATSAAAGASFAWKAIGPLPMLNNFPNFGGVLIGAVLSNSTGRIAALAPDPQTSGRVFVGTAGGGVWMTGDGGATFKPIFDSEPTQAIGAIALNLNSRRHSRLRQSSGPRQRRIRDRRLPQMRQRSPAKLMMAGKGPGVISPTAECRRARWW